MNHSPHERKSPGVNRGSVGLRGGPLLELKYTEIGEEATAATRPLPSDPTALSPEQREDLEYIDFWMRPERLPFAARWEAQPVEQPRPYVCFGNLPCYPRHRIMLWIWQPSGYLLDLGEAKLGGGRDIAERVARLVPDAAVLDCRADYERMAA